MVAVKIGSTLRIYNDEVKTFSGLPPKAYIVKFDKMSGFYMEEYFDIVVDEKIYGEHDEKVKKVLKSFEFFKRVSRKLLLSSVLNI